MMKFEKTLSGLVTVIRGAFLVAPLLTRAADVSSSDSAPAAADGIEEVTVTARRVEEKLQAVPIAVTAIRGADLDKLNIQTAADLQFHTPNLYIRNDSLGGTLQPSFILRGQVQTLTTDENVALYVADVPQSTRAISGELYDIAQIQVVKGPQGTLFGKNSNSGAVVVTPNRPTNEFGGWLEAQVGNYWLRETTAVLNVPIIADKLAVRIAGNWARQDGTVTNTLPGYDDWDDQNHWSARASFLFTPLDSLENITVFDHLYRNEIPTPWIDLAAGPGLFGQGLVTQALAQQAPLGLGARPGVTGYHNYAPDGSFMTNALFANIWGVSNATTLEVNNHLTLKNVFGYRKEQAASGLNLSGLQGYLLQPLPFFPGTAGYDALNDTITSHNVMTLSEELQLIGHGLDGHLNGIAGFFFSNGHDHLREQVSLEVNGLYLPGQPSVDNDIQYYKSKALFGEATYDLSHLFASLHGLKYTLGARETFDDRALLSQYFVPSLTGFTPASYNTNYATYPATGVCALLAPGTANLLPGTNPATCQLPNSTSFSGFSWNNTLAYELNDRVNLYASYKKGYKAGGMNNFDRNLPALQPYMPETLKVWELGEKISGRIGDLRWYLNGDYFNGVYHNLQTQAIPDFSADFGLPPQSQVSLVIINNVGAHMQGIEVENGLRYGDLEFSGTYSWLKQYYTRGALPNTSAEFRAGTGALLAGTAYPGAPRQTASGSLSYRLSRLPAAVGDVSATASLSWHDNAPGGVPQASIAALPAFKSLDLRADWLNVLRSPVDVGFWMKNATNEIYKSTCLDNRLTLGYFGCQFARPRTYAVTVKYRFGAEHK
jgi:iron complex outermembrane receptor protein